MRARVIALGHIGDDGDPGPELHLDDEADAAAIHAGIAERVERYIDQLPLSEPVDGPGPETDSLRARLRRVHGWACGRETPPPIDEIDTRSTGLYGICYLTVTADPGLLRRDVGRRGDGQVAYKRLFFRQTVYAVRYHEGAPEDVTRMIDRAMAAIGLDPRYDWRDAGTEVVMAWARETGTVFFPLAVAMDQAARLFLSLPAADAPRADLDRWARRAATYAAILGGQHLSRYHGTRIARILACWHRIAARGARDIPALRAQLDKTGEPGRLAAARAEALGLDDDAALAEEIRSIEIDMGLRAAAPGAGGHPGSKRRRRGRTRGSGRGRGWRR